MRRLDDITNSMDISLSKFQEMVKDREVWHASLESQSPWSHKELDTTERVNWTDNGGYICWKAETLLCWQSPCGPYQGYGPPSSHIWFWELNREGRAPKNWCLHTVVLEKTPESLLDSKEIKPVNAKRNQPWVFIGRTDAEAEAPVFWSTDVNNWLMCQGSV